ncbi:MAG TPA: protease complex subunit PrcB family protein [Pyrinomonadaceae bacterium]|nr:protease complex subunit PrcB family protein [Pyrinomonadaceae bacterium]
MLALNGATTAGCDSKQAAGAQNKNDAQANANASPQSPAPAAGEEKPVSGEAKEVKILAQGGYGQVEEPFIVVARDEKVYAALRALVESLPEVNADYFRTNAVVAAFLGTRRTGGYSVNITAAPGGALVVAEQSPPKDAITTQALTNPFKVVAVPVGDEQSVELSLQGEWASALLRPYRVSSGTFETSGGITGRGETFKLEGGLSVARRAGLATVLFDLKSAGAKKQMALKSAASGIVEDGGRLSLVTDAGTLVQRPHNFLRATANLTGDENKLSLVFSSLPAKHPESFAGRGSVEAEATAPAPARRDSQDDL